METTDKIAFKNSLKQFCQHTIEERIAAARQSIAHAQEAANNEEKSSAGDKYETARAMSHLQKDMHARQLAACLKELGVLHGIDTGTLYTTVCAGAFIQTGAGLFFIAAGLGKQLAEGGLVFFLSPHAPLAGMLANKKKGDQFVFNGNSVIILDVW